MRKLFLGLAALSISAICGANNMMAEESFSGYQVAREGAWCWFADPRAIHYENSDGSINASWLAYIDVHGNIKATQYDFITGKKNEVLVRSYFQPDDHNNPTFLVLPDERVLIIYSRHTDEPAFYYRVSKRPGDITELGEEKKIVTANNTTYPSPFILSDDPEHFYLCWRGIGWHPTIAKLSLPDDNDDVNIEWGPFQMVQSTGARPYAKYYSNGKDKIFFTYTTGHPDNEQPNWLYCNVININASSKNGVVTTKPTLEDIKGTTLSTIEDGKFNVSKTDSYKSSYPYTVVDATSGIRDWVWQITLDENGYPVIPMVKINDAKDNHVYHLAKWNGSNWNVTKLADGGGWFHASSGTEKCYSGGEAIDPENPNNLYLSIPTTGDNGKVYEIWKYTVDDQGNVTETEQITKNSTKNNVRPYVLNNHGNSPLKLGWLNGDYYYWMVNKNYPAGFPTDVYCDYEYNPSIGEYIDSPSLSKEYNKTVTASDSESISIPAGNFTLSVNLALDQNAYYGTIISSSALSYAVDQSQSLPSASVNGTEYKSTNRLLTSDDWASNSSGTNGDYWPTKLGEFNLTFTYDGNTLVIYRNGVIDQKIAVEDLSVGDLKIGGFAGTLVNASLFNQCLNQDELSRFLTQKSFASLNIPERTCTDLVLPSKAGTDNVSWTSGNEEIISNNGTFRSPEQETVVVLTATVNGLSKDFNVIAETRDISKNLLASYTFETTDTYTTNNQTYVKDLSGNGYDLSVMGNAKINGTLDLSDNTASGFSSNGYAIVPADVMEGLRSYTFIFNANLKATTGQPRFYDFGVNSANSLFCRANAFCAGIKYLGGTTTMVNGSTTFSTGTNYEVAVTFDARTKETKLYVDGALAGSGTVNVNEPYMLAQVGSCSRNYIGRTQWWDGSYANDNKDYIGSFDNFKIFNTALSAEEIAAAKEVTTVNPAIFSENDNNASVYDLQGRMITKSASKESLESLNPGIYISGGKKIVVK